MTIVLLTSLADDTLREILADNVLYRPDLLHKNQAMLGPALADLHADAVVTSSDVPAKALKIWSTSRTSPAYCVFVSVGSAAGGPESAVPHQRPDSPNCTLLQARGANEATAYLEALQILEHRCARWNQSSRAECGTRLATLDKRVLMVGAGLVNLVTALRLQKHGFTVHLADRGPDPRKAAVWTEYGCSRGGDDARMFTLSEMDNYHDKLISSTMNGQFRQDVTNLGWRIHEGALSAEEQHWLREFERIPTWLATQYNQDIFGLSRTSLSGWQKWIEDDPELFKASFLRDGILRLHSDAEYHESQVRRQTPLGAIRRVLSPHQLAAEHPALADAVRGGHIAGCIDSIGFSLQAHRFIDGLLERLTYLGATFQWNQEAHCLAQDSSGRVRGVRLGTEVVEADHYVVSPGAYGGSLLDSTRSRGMIHGVLGAWLRIPNVDPPLTQSLKLARKGHITPDANIIISNDALGSQSLIIGGGYGYTGINPHNIDPSLLRAMYGALLDTGEKYFPRAYRAAAASGGVEPSFKYCVRPWTPTGLGIFETIPTSRGGVCVITGGHNTGGFTQAPVTAQAVIATVEGRDHPMHYLYEPGRASAYLAH